MSRVGAELVGTFVDDVLSEATVDSWDSLKNRSLRFIDKITFHQGTCAKIEKFLKSKLVEPGKRLALKKIPLPQTIERRAKESLQSRAGRIAANSILFCVNHPVPRFGLTAGLLAGIVLAVGFSPIVIPTTLAAAYAIKIASAYTFMGVKWGIQKLRKNKKPDQVAQTTPSPMGRHAIGKAMWHSVSEVAFGRGQKNPYLNLLDIVMTVTSGVLLIPTCAQLNGWIAQSLKASLQEIPERSMTSGAATSAGLNQVGEAAESGIARQIGNSTMQQAGRQVAVRIAQQEAGAVSHSFFSRLLAMGSGLPERGFGVVGQGTIKYFGGNLARRYAPDLADEAAIGVVAVAGAAGFARMIPLKLRGIGVKFSTAWKKSSEPVISPSWAMNGFCRIM